MHQSPVAAWLLLSIATGPAVGWLVGDRSVRPVDPGLDAEPLGAWAALENTGGVLLAAAAIGAAAALVVQSRRGELRAGGAVTVGCGALLATCLLAVAAEAGGQLDGGDAAGLRYALLAYTFPAMAFVPDPDQPASLLLLISAGTVQWMLFSLGCAGVLAAVDRPESLPDRI